MELTPLARVLGGGRSRGGCRGADFDADATRRRVIEPKCGFAAALQDCWNGWFVAGIFDALVSGSNRFLIRDEEAYVKERRIGGVQGVLAVHKDENETIFAFQNGEPAVATPFCDFEREAALEKVSAAGNVVDGQVYVIEFVHEEISLA